MENAENPEKVENENKEKKQCPYCGEDLRENTSVCRFCGKRVGELPAKCRQCGVVIEDKTKGCPHCGKKKDTTGAIWGIAVIFALLLLGGCCYLVYFLFNQ